MLKEKTMQGIAAELAGSGLSPLSTSSRAHARSPGMRLQPRTAVARAYATTSALTSPLVQISANVHAEAARHFDAARRATGDERDDALRRGSALLGLLQRSVVPDEPMGRELASIYDYLARVVRAPDDDSGLELAATSLKALAASWEARMHRSGGEQ